MHVSMEGVGIQKNQLSKEAIKIAGINKTKRLVDTIASKNE